jgi:3-keto-disaccharide hydrolase
MPNQRLLPVLVAAVLIGAAVSAQEPEKREWIQLFNGKNLDGWTPKITGFPAGENYANTFRVENGVLKVRYDGYDRFASRFGHLFYRDAFSHYIIAVEYRFVGEQVKEGPTWAIRNSGVMVHGQTPQSMPKDQDFPISIEAQFLGGNGKDPRTTANLCTPGTNVVMNGTLETRHCINSRSQTYHGEEWVRAEIEVHGDGMIRHRVNGEEVLAYEMPQIGGGAVSNHDPAVKRDGQLLSSGTISLQSESHPIEFRKVELLNLVGCTDPKAKNYKTYYLKPDPAACRY